jgi:chitinase
MYIPKPRLATLGFALMLLTTPSYGQDIPAQIGPAYNNMFYGPPHNVIYWAGATSDAAGNNILNSLTSSCDPNNGPTGSGGTGPGSASGCYTDVILSSVFPLAGSVCTQLNLGNLYGLDLPTVVSQLHNAGKTVLISFGGAGPNLQSQQYEDCYNGNMSTLVQMLVSFVQQNNFDGVDIDFEDSGSFGGDVSCVIPSAIAGQCYDGIPFLEQLTTGLGTQLSFPHNIITHAPQTGYWTNSYPTGYQYNPYVQIYYDVGQYIAWFNNQFYNQECTAEDTQGVNNAPSQCATDYSNDYQTIVQQTGLPPILLVLGLAACPPNTTNPITGQTGCGYGWLNNYDVMWLVSQLQNQYPDQFGGVMAWDADGDNGTWNSEVWNALKTYQDKWYAYDDQTQQCVTDTGGTVVVETCAGGSNLSQFWQFSANAIINQSTKNCLDAQNGIHTQPCSAGDLYQLWQFFGNTNNGATANNGVTIVSRHSLYELLYNGGTAYCLDASVAPPDAPCTGNTYQGWMGGAQ